jgi:hypothetical protein
VLRVDASKLRECLATHSTIDYLEVTTLVIPKSEGQLDSNMANFFDLRARQKEAAAAASSKTPTQPEKNKLQPWVEK